MCSSYTSKRMAAFSPSRQGHGRSARDCLRGRCRVSSGESQVHNQSSINFQGHVKVLFYEGSGGGAPTVGLSLHRSIFNACKVEFTFVSFQDPPVSNCFLFFASADLSIAPETHAAFSKTGLKAARRKGRLQKKIC